MVAAANKALTAGLARGSEVDISGYWGCYGFQKQAGVARTWEENWQAWFPKLLDRASQLRAHDTK